MAGSGERRRWTCFAVPGRLDAATGGTIYDRRVVFGLREAGWHVEVLELPGAFPRPSEGDRRAAADLFAGLPDRSTVVFDGLAFGPLADLVERHAARLQFVPLLHLPLGSDPTLSADERRRLGRLERDALQHARHIIVTGEVARAALVGGGLGSDRIDVIPPGTDQAPVARGSGGGRVHLVCVGTVNAVKGHELLLRALCWLRDSEWYLSCAGSVTRDPRSAASVRRLIEALDLKSRVAILGERSPEEVSRLFDSADAFVLATRFETYGMAVAEALARGLPVVSTQTGAIPHLIGDDAGVLVPPDDEAALTAALRCVIDDKAWRARLRAGAIRARVRLPVWSSTVEKFAYVLTRVAERD